MRASKILAAASIAATVMACSAASTSGDSAPGTGKPGASNDGGDPPAPASESGGPPLADAAPPADDPIAKLLGTYAVQAKVFATSQIQGLPPSSATTLAYGLAKIERDGAGARIVEQGCHVIVEPAESAATTRITIADAVPISVPASTSPLDVKAVAGAVVVTRGEHPVGVGVKLTNAATDALPTAPTDSRVWDQDGDGQPGITIDVSGAIAGKLFAVQRQRSSYSATLAADGKALSGPYTERSEQSVIAANPPVLKASATSTPDPAKSTIRLVRDDADTCAKLLSKLTKLFPN